MKLITGIKKKINENKIADKGKSFEELVEEAKIAVGKGGPLIIDVVNSIPELLAFYDEIKTCSFEEVSNKSKVNKESLLAYKLNGLSSRYEAGTDRDRILKRLDLIYELLELYKTGKHNEFLRITKFNITSSEDKISLSKVMTKISVDDITIGKVIELAEESGLISKDDLFTNFIESRGHYLWSRLKIMPFQEYVNSIAYLREYVSVITQHKVKGSEYDNVLVLLDNGKWNQYNFDSLFGKGSVNENVQKRTKKLFYVAITRAMKNLIVKSGFYKRVSASEKFLFDQKIPVLIDDTVQLKIDGFVKDLSGFRDYKANLKLVRGVVDTKNKIDFKAVTNTTNHDILKWKVKNDNNCTEARGEITDHQTYVKPERTAFLGNHFVECYSIKNNVCIAKDMVNVVVRQ